MLRRAGHSKGKTKTAARSAEASPGDLGATGQHLAKAGVRHCLAAYVDVHGVPKAKAVPIDHFQRMMRGSELFTGAALDGLGQTPSDDELALLPDPGAITQLPWRPEVAWAPGCLLYHDEPWPMCARTVLKTPNRSACAARARLQPWRRMRALPGQARR